LIHRVMEQSRQHALPPNKGGISRIAHAQSRRSEFVAVVASEAARV